MLIRPQWNVPQRGIFGKPLTTSKKVIENTSTVEKDNSHIIDIMNNINNITSNNSGNKSSVNQYSSHLFNVSRLHEDLCDKYGAEEPGAPREW